MMFDDKVYGSFVYPDTVYSDNFVTYIVECKNPKADVVLSHCPRLSNEGFLEEISKYFIRKPSSLSPRQLLNVALRHIHSETKMYEWTDTTFGYSPVMVF